jgi:hypothetical protein
VDIIGYGHVVLCARSVRFGMIGSKLTMGRPPITHVAIRWRGDVFSLPAPNRHQDVIRLIVKTIGDLVVDVPDDDKGFLDASGRYLRRKAALHSAIMNEQLKTDSIAETRGILLSDDIW